MCNGLVNKVINLINKLTHNYILKKEKVFIMKNTKSLKVKVIAAALASVCAVSTIGAVVVSADNSVKGFNGQNLVSQNSVKYNTPFEYKCNGATPYGYDWTYSIDSLNVSVDCDYDFNNYQYTFHIDGVEEGYVNVVLMYVNMQNQWVRVPMKLYVDRNLNVTIVDNASERQTSCYEQLKNIIERDNVSSYTVVKTHDDNSYKLVVLSKDEYDIMHYEFYRIENNGVTRLGSYSANVSCYIDYKTARLGVIKMEDGCCYSGRLSAVNEGISIDWQSDGYISFGRALSRHGEWLTFTDKNNLSLIEMFR